MPFDSNGNASLVPGYFVQNGDDVLPSQHNPPLEDVASMLGQTLLRDGRAPLSGNLNANGNKVTNLAPPTNPNDAARLTDLPTGLETSEIVHEVDATTLVSGSSIDVTGIDTGFRRFEIEGSLASITSNPSTVNFQLSVGDGTTWFEITNAPLVRWSNGGQTNRYFFATVDNLDDDDLAICFHSKTANDDPYTAFVTPSQYASRPITALRFRIVPPSGATTLNITKLRVRGIRD